MKFGGKQTMADKMAVAKSRVGKNPGVSKGKATLPPAKVRPTGNPFKGKVGIKVTKKV